MNANRAIQAHITTHLVQPIVHHVQVFPIPNQVKFLTQPMQTAMVCPLVPGFAIMDIIAVAKMMMNANHAHNTLTLVHKAAQLTASHAKPDL